MILAPLLFWAASFNETLRAGLLALQKGDLAAAQTQLESAAHLEPKNGTVWLALAQTYWKENKLPEGDDAAQKAVQLDRYPESAYFLLAQTCLQAQRFEPALRLLEAGTKVHPQSAQLVLATGVAQYGLRRFSQAIDGFLQTIELAPELEQPYRFLGRMLDQAEGRLPAITDKLAYFYKTQPENYLSSFLYAKALGLANGDLEERERLLRQSIGINGNLWESHLELAGILEQKHDYLAAVAEYERVTNLAPLDPVPHYRLARLYDRLGKHEQAEAERALHAKLSEEEKQRQAKPPAP